MAYSAVINGASAVFFFSYHEMDEEYLKSVCVPVAEELNRFSELFLSQDTNAFVVDSPGALIEYRAVLAGNVHYLLVSNPNTDPVRFDIRPMLGEKSHGWAAERSISPGGVALASTGLEDYLPPSGVQIYRMYQRDGN